MLVSLPLINLNKTMIKSILSAITFLIPQATAAKIIANLIIWGAEKLVKNTKTQHNDEFLDMVKKAVNKPEKLTESCLARKNFEAAEFLRSRKADELGIINIPNQEQLSCGVKIADKAQELREALGIPMIITSGFRCPELNKAVGGAPRSKHMQFLAIDFIIKGLSPKEGVQKIKESGVSVDRCFVERKCIHMQIRMDESLNKNFFGEATKVKGKWIVKPLK